MDYSEWTKRLDYEIAKRDPAEDGLRELRGTLLALGLNPVDVATGTEDQSIAYLLGGLKERVAELEARLAEQEWRPVTEPPQMADNYHVWRRPGYHDFCHFNGVNWRTTGGDSITHWQPLPAPPQSENVR